MSRYGARFVVIEGGEGSGKGSLIQAAQKAFPNLCCTREPGGSPSAELIREVMLHPEAKRLPGAVQFGLTFAARTVHFQETILPALNRGRSVLSDRFDASTYAYQIFGQEVPELTEHFWNMRSLVVGQRPPDFYIFLDVNPAEGLRRRAAARGENHFDERRLDFHERIRQGFLSFFERKGLFYQRIDANQPLENVLAAGLNTLRQLISA